MRKFAEQKLSSMTENILYDILDINILKRIKKVSQFWGLLFRFHFSQKCKKSSIISITDDLISEFAKQKIISMIGNMLYDILDVNILKTIFCHAPSLCPLYFTILLHVLPKLLGGELDSPPPQSEVLGAPRPDYTILYDYTFRAKVIEGGVDWLAQSPKHAICTRDAREYFPSGALQSTPPWGRNNAIISSA